MSVSAELLCSFELLKPLDSSALKNHIKKGRNRRANMQQLNSPVSERVLRLQVEHADARVACAQPKRAKFLNVDSTDFGYNLHSERPGD